MSLINWLKNSINNVPTIFSPTTGSMLEYELSISKCFVNKVQTEFQLLVKIRIPKYKMKRWFRFTGNAKKYVQMQNRSVFLRVQNYLVKRVYFPVLFSSLLVRNLCFRYVRRLLWRWDRTTLLRRVLGIDFGTIASPIFFYFFYSIGNNLTKNIVIKKCNK